MFKKFIDSISTTLNVSTDHIQNVIKENKQYLEAELDVVKESQEGISALKNYAQVETPSMEAAIFSLAETFEKIEIARKEKVDELNAKFIEPLEEIVGELENLKKEAKDAERAKKALEKAEGKRDKTQAKPKEKLKAGELDVAIRAVNFAQEQYEKEEKEKVNAAELFNKKKNQVIQTILKNLAEIERNYHEKIIRLLGHVTQKAEEIKVEEESKIQEDSELED